MNTSVTFESVKHTGVDRTEQTYQLTFSDNVVVDIDMDNIESDYGVHGEIEFAINMYEDGISRAELNMAVKALNECIKQHQPKPMREIAEEHNLELIEVTHGTNGYPCHLEDGIIGFDTFEQIEEIAGEHGLSIVALHRRDGWQFWEVSDSCCAEPFDMAKNENANVYHSAEDAIVFYNDEIANLEYEKTNLEEDDEDELERINDAIQEDLDNIQYIKDNFKPGRIVVVDEFGMDVIARFCTSFYNDTHNYTIGLVRW